jgi:hypothetical protein
MGVCCCFSVRIISLRLAVVVWISGFFACNSYDLLRMHKFTDKYACIHFFSQKCGDITGLGT